MAASKTLGPWNRGLNLTSNRSLSLFLENNELGAAENVTFTPEGFVQPRPGCKKYIFDFGAYDTIEVVGNLRLPSGETIAIIQTILAGQAKLWKVTDKNTCSVLYSGIPLNAKVTHVLAYDSVATNPIHSGVFFFCDKLNATVKNSALDLSGTWSKVADQWKVPASHRGFIVKDRLFLFDYDESTMWWSPANNIMDFDKLESAGAGGTGTDVFAKEPIDRTTPADGFMGVEFYNNNFYIFKKSKSYMFTYQALPLEDGYLRKISDEMGALSSTMFRNNVVVLNRKGVFRLEGSEFVDMQRSMNFRFEIPIDHPNILRQNAFITDFNEDVVFGYKDVTTGKEYFYCMNGTNGAWSEWKYDYLGISTIARPGSQFYRAQNNTSTAMIMLFHTFDKKFLTYMEYKPGATLPTYHMDGSTNSEALRYFPNVRITTAGVFGDSPLKFFKIYRCFMRFYLSDQPRPDGAMPDWILRINYNDYRFNNDVDVKGNPSFGVYPSNNSEFNEANVLPKPTPPLNKVPTGVLVRTYQVPIPQQRAKEIVVELLRLASSMTTDEADKLWNYDAGRPIENGYYFLLSSVWVDYEDKAGI